MILEREREREREYISLLHLLGMLGKIPRSSSLEHLALTCRSQALSTLNDKCLSRNVLLISSRLVKVFIRVLKNRSLLKMDNEQTPLVDHGRIATSTKLAYALGHVFNDLTAATWFSYTLIYLQRVALLEPIVAGAFLLLGKQIGDYVSNRCFLDSSLKNFRSQGQVVDAVMTPIFGFLVDRYRNKKLWHIVGSVMVTWSFPVIFGGFAKSSSVLAMLLYVTSITIFQTGWAAVQISHLSMIPSLSNSLLARADLTAIR